MNQTDEIEDRLDHPPLIWAPEGPIQGIDPERQLHDRKVIGTVEEKELRENEWGTYPVVTLKLPDGKRVQVAGFSTVLKNRLVERDPAIGERIGISFLGTKPSKRPGAKAYKDFALVTEGAGRTVSFGAITVEPDESTGPPVEEPTPEELAKVLSPEGNEW